jgi:hypothetical protein
MQNLDKMLKCHPEYIDIVIKAFKIYASKNDLDYHDILLDVTNMDIDTLNKKYKKYKKSTTPYAKINQPGSSYTFFMKENYQNIKNSLGKDKPTMSEVSKAVSEAWSKLDKTKKKKYENLAKNDRKRYDEEKDEINNKLELKNISKPKRPQSAFFFFLADVRPKIKKNNIGIKTTDIAKEGRIMWTNLNKNSKQKYQKISDLDKARYKKEKEEYQAELEKN